MPGDRKGKSPGVVHADLKWLTTELKFIIKVSPCLRDCGDNQRRWHAKFRQLKLKQTVPKKIIRVIVSRSGRWLGQ